MKTTDCVSPFAPFVTGVRHRQLILKLAWRRIEGRYRGSVLGLFWAVVDPLLMLAVYTFVFSILFEAKWGPASVEGSNSEFALFLFSGLIIYNVFAQCINEAPTEMIRHKSFVTEMVFPIEILSWVGVLVALFNFVISLMVLLVFNGVVNGTPPGTIVWFPLVLLPVVLGTLGFSWLFSSMGVYLRDITQMTNVLTTVVLFLSPIFYPASRVPESFRPYYEINPFASLLEMSKGALFRAESPDIGTLVALIAGSWVVAWLGYCWFIFTKKGFADVL